MAFLLNKPGFIAVLFLSLTAFEGEAGSPIAPPYGFQLGSKIAQVRSNLASQNLTPTQPASQGSRKVWVVTGLKEENLSRIRLYFDQTERLAEVELQYENPGWAEVTFSKYLDFFKKQLEQMHGPSLETTNTTRTEQQTRITLTCLQWRQSKIRLRAIKFTATSLVKKVKAHYGAVSLHYQRVP